MPFIGLYLLLNVLSNYGVHHENNQTTDDERCRALVTHNTQAGRKQLNSIRKIYDYINTPCTLTMLPLVAIMLVHEVHVHK